MRQELGDLTVTVEAKSAEAKSAVHARFDQLLDRMHGMFNRKDRAYAGEIPLANIRSSERIGVPPSTACYIRMGDKFGRMANLIKKANLGDGDESVLDNAIDLAVYSLIFMILHDEETGVRRAIDTAGHRPDGKLWQSPWRGSMVESLAGPDGYSVVVDPAKYAQPGPVTARPLPSSDSPARSSSPSPAEHPTTTTVTATRSEQIECLARFLYSTYIDQFRQQFVLDWLDIDVVTQTAWRATAELVIQTYPTGWIGGRV